MIFILGLIIHIKKGFLKEIICIKIEPKGEFKANII